MCLRQFQGPMQHRPPSKQLTADIILCSCTLFILHSILLYMPSHYCLLIFMGRMVLTTDDVSMMSRYR